MRIVYFEMCSLECECCLKCDATTWWHQTTMWTCHILNLSWYGKWTAANFNLIDPFLLNNYLIAFFLFFFARRLVINYSFVLPLDSVWLCWWTIFYSSWSKKEQNWTWQMLKWQHRCFGLENEWVCVPFALTNQTRLTKPITKT